ncbi:hypothetical protein LA6_004847 [Marinibacterium anthonyi]|nr:hypothetical protein LA6_004847 [Marinibacterium anthonyi]
MTSFGRRTLLAGIPALAAGAAMLRAPSVTAQTAPAHDTSSVTYLPVAAQRQLKENRPLLAGKPYESYFDPHLMVPTEDALALQMGPLDKADCLTPSVRDLNRLLDPSYKTPKQGYAVLDGSTVYVQNSLFFPGATAEMLRWWFTWHPIEKERYMLWFPQAHIENSVQDPARLANTSLSYEDRLYDNPNHVKELVGPQAMELLIRFSDPAKIGFDPAAFKRAGFTANASGIVSPAQAPDVVNSLMVHIARDIDGGMELVSRYWIGAHPELRRFDGAEKAEAMLSQIGWNDQVAEMTAYELAVHDMIEFNHLAGILPALFSQFGEG